MDSLPVFFGGVLALLLLTSFAKIFTALSVLRVGIGLEGLGMGAIVGGFALLLSAVVMQPQLQPMGGLEGLLRGDFQVNKEALERNLRPFMERNSDPSVAGRIVALTSVSAAPASSGDRSAAENSAEGSNSKTVASPSFAVVALSFMITELKKALELSILFILPFVVIDLLVVNILMALNVSQLPSRIVSLPFKLLLFFSVDGWTLISEKLLGGYH